MVVNSTAVRRNTSHTNRWGLLLVNGLAVTYSKYIYWTSASCSRPAELSEPRSCRLRPDDPSSDAALHMARSEGQ